MSYEPRRGIGRVDNICGGAVSHAQGTYPVANGRTAGRLTLTVAFWYTRPGSWALVWPCGRCAGIGPLLEM